jgi:hypothetical protein
VIASRAAHSGLIGGGGLYLRLDDRDKCERTSMLTPRSDDQACSRDHDPCDDGGETGEQQQVIK